MVFFPTLRRNDVIPEPVKAWKNGTSLWSQDLYIHYELRCLSNACQFQIQSRALEGMSLERNGKQEQPHICVYGPKISNSVSIIGSMHMTVYFSCNLVSPSSWEQGNIEERSHSLFEITISPFVLYR